MTKLLTFEDCESHQHMFHTVHITSDLNNRNGPYRLVYHTIFKNMFIYVWYANDKMHRLDGPAHIKKDVSTWWINGTHIDGVKDQKEFEEWLYNNS